MRANRSPGFVEINKKAIENNLHIKQELLWVSKSYIMRPRYQELKITLILCNLNRQMPQQMAQQIP